MADGKRIWGIHAGRTGDADRLFLGKGVIALGWRDFGSFDLPNQREAYKVRFAAVYQTSSVAKTAGSAGQMYRFVHELKTGDYVAYSSKLARRVHIGRVTGDYQYRPEVDEAYPNQRTVDWLRRDIPRTAFSNAALFELGSALSFFEIRNYAAEFLATLNSKSSPPTANGTMAQVASAEESSAAAIEAEEAEQLTRDFILKRLAQRFKGLDLEPVIKHLLECMGYRVRLTPPNDPSVDLTAHRDLLGIEPPMIKVQVKSSDGFVNDKDVSALVGKLQQGDLGLVIALSDFTPPAMHFASQRSNLRLINGEQLVDLILEHYDRFDAKYKAALPLRRVYIPDVEPQEQ